MLMTTKTNAAAMTLGKSSAALKQRGNTSQKRKMTWTGSARDFKPSRTVTVRRRRYPKSRLHPPPHPTVDLPDGSTRVSCHGDSPPHTDFMVSGRSPRLRNPLPDPAMYIRMSVVAKGPMVRSRRTLALLVNCLFPFLIGAKTIKAAMVWDDLLLQRVCGGPSGRSARHYPRAQSRALWGLRWCTGLRWYTGLWWWWPIFQQPSFAGSPAATPPLSLPELQSPHTSSVLLH